MSINNIRLIAFYLPQFHPILENDKWWGKGFTEWTNVGKAKPLFKGHYQPRVPADLGYYDLRVSETRQAQADMAKEYGVEGFCYWHYWFGNGKRLLERPFNEVLSSGKPDFPFCLAWANESWKGFPHGLKNRNTLIEQMYLGEIDYSEHFYQLLPAFKDKRYICVDGKPLFFIYKPFDSEEVTNFINTWRKLAKNNGIKDFYFVGHESDARRDVNSIIELGFDAVSYTRLNNYQQSALNLFERAIAKLRTVFFSIPRVYNFRKVSKYFIDESTDINERIIPTIISGWDHTPRSGKDGLVLTDFTPINFKEYIRKVFDIVRKKEKNKIVFLKSWNEWAEGNYIEPDLKWGKDFLKVLNEEINK